MAAVAEAASSSADSRGIYRRTRSRDVSLNLPSIEHVASLSSPLRGLGGSGGGADGDLFTPDLLKRPSSSDLLRRGSGSSLAGALHTPSFSRGPSGIGLGLSLRSGDGGGGGGGTSLPGGYFTRGLSSILGGGVNGGTASDVPEYLRGTGSIGLNLGGGATSIPRMSSTATDTGGEEHGGVHNTQPAGGLLALAGAGSATSHMIQMPVQKFTRSKSRELAALGLVAPGSSASLASTDSFQSYLTHTNADGGPFTTGATRTAGLSLPPHHHANSLSPMGIGLSSHALASVRAQFARGSSSDSDSPVTGGANSPAAPSSAHTTVSPSPAPVSPAAASSTMPKTSLPIRERAGSAFVAAATIPGALSAHSRSVSTGSEYAHVFSTPAVPSPVKPEASHYQTSGFGGTLTVPSQSTTGPPSVGSATNGHKKRKASGLTPLPTAAPTRPGQPATLESEHARIAQVVSLLRTYTPSGAALAAAAANASAAEVSQALAADARADDLLAAYASTCAAWREERTQDDDHEDEVAAQAVVTLSLTANERATSEASNTPPGPPSTWTTAHLAPPTLATGGAHSPGQISHTISGGGSGGGVSSSLGPSRLSSVSHPRLLAASHLVRAVIDAMHLNRLEVVVLSLYLERLEPEWANAAIEKGTEVARAIVRTHKPTQWDSGQTPGEGGHAHVAPGSPLCLCSLFSSLLPLLTASPPLRVVHGEVLLQCISDVARLPALPHRALPGLLRCVRHVSARPRSDATRTTTGRTQSEVQHDENIPDARVRPHRTARRHTHRARDWATGC